MITPTPRAKAALRRLAGAALRPVPIAPLGRLAGRPGPLALAARQALLGRPSTIVDGVGAGLVIDPGPDNADYALGTNELTVQQRIARTVRDGMVVYDVGANIGFFTLIFARLVGPSGCVYAFEADLANAATARANALRNGFPQVTVCARAAGAHSGFTSLHLAAYAGGHSTVATGDPDSDRGVVTVEVTSLDDFADVPGVRPPDLVKIDVEGAEEDVLDGMERLLRDVRPLLLIELDDADPARHDSRAAALVERLDGLGYRSERLTDAYPDLAWTVSHWLAQPGEVPVTT